MRVPSLLVLAVLAIAAVPIAAGAAPQTCLGRRATLDGTAGADTLVGTAGDDVIAARGGGDDVDGRGGNDRICGGRGDDDLTGGPGNDRIAGGKGADGIGGGEGVDTASFADARAGIEVRLQSGRATGQGFDALTAVESIVGSSTHVNHLFGDDGANALTGGAVYDYVDGGGGDDSIRGLDGGDALEGGSGTDWLDGGGGTDRCSDAESSTGCER